MPKPLTCPKCGSESLARAHRQNWFEHVLSEIGVFPFRCSKCSHRFSRWDLEALSMEHIERHAWLTSARLFWVAVASLLIAFLVYYYKAGR